MKVKRYSAATMQRALKQISDELGPDAVILSNQRIKGRLEIVAAVDYDSDDAEISQQVSFPVDSTNYDNVSTAAINHTRQPRAQTHTAAIKESSSAHISLAQLDAAKRKLALQDELEKTYISRQKNNSEAGINERQNTTKISSYEQETITKQESNNDLVQMKAEIHVLKALLEKTVNPVSNPWGNWTPKNSLQATLWQRLDDLGTEQWLIKKLVSHTDGSEALEKTWRGILRTLAKSIPIMNVAKSKVKSCVALLGPTGVGKTTTLGKMAAQHVLQYGNEKIVLISADNYRIGAQDQLRSFARILSVPLYFVSEKNSLESILNKIPLDYKVFIDTAGMHPKDPLFDDQLNMLKSVSSRITCMLTLDVTCQSRVLQQVFKHYQKIHISSVILTKVDDAFVLGEALSVIIKEEIPLSHFTNGQRIPEDIHPATAKELLRQALLLSPDHGHINISNTQQSQVSVSALK
jgi:flagellar biosynthesis protein FlhF